MFVYFVLTEALFPTLGHGKLMPTTAAMEATTAGAASKARPPAGGKASGISAMIKATERAGARPWLRVKPGRTVESAAVVEAAVTEVTVAEIAVTESVVTKVPAVRDPGVMVEKCPTAMPVVSPVSPAPSKSSEETDSKPETEGEPDASPKNSGDWIPAWVGNDRGPVHKPRIIGRHVHDLGVGRFDDDRIALRRYVLLFGALQMASLAGLLTQGLHGIRYVLGLVYICLAKR